MNQQALEAAAKAAHYAINSVGPVWDCWPDSHKAVYYKLAIAALTAYAEACGERVVWGPATDYANALLPDSMWLVLRPGEELVVRKSEGGTDGK